MKIMAFSLDWFKSVPGILISLGVIFLIAALIMFIVSSIKEKKESKKDNVEALGQNQMPPKKEAEQVQAPVTPAAPQAPVQQAPVEPVQTPVAPQPEVVPVQPVAPAPEPVQTPAVAQEPVVQPTPVVETPVVPPVVETPAPAPVEPVQSIDSISSQPNMDDTIIGLEQPEAVNLEKTVIYNGNDPALSVQSAVAQAPVQSAPEAVSQPIPMDAPTAPASGDNTIKPITEMEQL